MSTAKIDIKEIKTVYEKLKQPRSPEQEKKFSNYLHGKGTEEERAAFRITEKVARQATFEEFKDFILKGDVPGVKLAASEMALLSAGLTVKPSTWCFIGAIVVEGVEILIIT
jgi:hypothetical protein